jgi:hypothetical protein
MMRQAAPPLMPDAGNCEMLFYHGTRQHCKTVAHFSVLSYNVTSQNGFG